MHYQRVKCKLKLNRHLNNGNKWIAHEMEGIVRFIENSPECIELRSTLYTAIECWNVAMSVLSRSVKTNNGKQP